MPEQSDLDRRLRAVERALTDGDHDVAALQDAAAIVDRLEDLEARVADLEERTADLDAATQAIRGYVGNVRSVNEEVESRADAALAAVARIEARLDEAETGTSADAPSSPRIRDRSGAQGHGANQASPSDGLANGEYGIEMPVPGASLPAREENDDEDDRSVIERVREAL